MGGRKRPPIFYSPKPIPESVIPAKAGIQLATIEGF